MQGETPAGEGSIPKAEQPWNKEQVMELPGLIHDKAVVHMQKLYELGPDRIPFFFHTYHDPEDGSDGHVASVVKLGKLYQAAVAGEMAKTGKSETDLPSSDCDPLHLYEKANKYFDGLTINVPDGKGHSRKIEKPSPERRKLLIDLSFETAAALHDLANVTAGVDWQSIKKGELPAVSVSFREAMYSDFTVEGQAFLMYEDFIGVFREELGLSFDEARYVASLGSEYIQDTSLSRLFLPLSSHSLVELALFDQITAVFSPNSLKEVFGLINEMGVGIRGKRSEEDGAAAAIVEQAVTITRDVFFRDFVLNQLEKYETRYRIDPSLLFALLDGYKETDPAGFARIMGIEKENAGKMGKLEDFVRSRLDLRLAAGSIVWLNDGFISVRNRLDRSLPMFDLICRACDLFNNRFYDPTLKAGDFHVLAS